MGNVIRPRTTNVFDIPQDILVHFVGKGLTINREERPPTLEVVPGNGLTMEESGAIGLQKPHPENSSIFSFVSNISIKLDGRRLMLTKTISFYEAKRNCDNYIVDFVFLHNDEIMEEVLFNDYGYCGMSTSFRENSEASPNFYKKQ